MTQIETIIAEIERRIEQFKEERSKVPPTTPKSVDRLSLGARIAALEETLVFINSLPAAEEQPNEDLEAEIDRYFKDDKWFSTPLGDIARHFANWQKEQMMKSAIKIDAKIVNDEMSGCVVDCEQGCLVLEPHTYPIGQQLKILIIKEDKQ